jgi:hypothetical protein
MEFSGTVSGGSGDKAGEVEDVLGTIAGGGGSSGSIKTPWGRQQWQLPKPAPMPSPA